jgi:spermidine synthase
MLAFLAAAVTLYTQVLVHRMISAKLLNNYAFLVISLTMLGFAFSGLILTRLLDRVLERLGDAATAFASLFALSLIGSSALFYDAPADFAYRFTTRSYFVWSLLRALPYAFLYTLPFLFLGLILGTLLGSRQLPTRQIYCFDLAGSSLGALLVLPAISSLGVERASLLGCAVLLLGACVLFPPQNALVRVGAAATVIAVGWSLAEVDRVFAMRYPYGSMLWASQEGRSKDIHVEHIVWDPLARIEVTRIPPPVPEETTFPCLLGGDHEFLKRFERVLSQNNYAFTFAVRYDGKRSDLEGIEQTIYASAYEASSVAHPRVLAIGVGGGFDILTALHFDADQVTGVEVNAATVGILKTTYRDYFKAWTQDPRVRIVHGEGRNYLSRSQDTYDIIQLSGVDSYSGTPGAAYVFSENYLYTAEAFDLYLSRLTENGIVNVMRLEYIPPAHMLRALTTAVASLRRLGVRTPGDHIAVLTATTGTFTALLVKRTPFTGAEVGRLKAWAGASPYFQVTAGQGANPSNNAYSAFLRMKDPAFERAFVEQYPYDIRPATDDWPFFFRSSYWWHLFATAPGVWSSVPILEYSLLVLFALVSGAVAFCLYLPLRLMASTGQTNGTRWRYALYCAGIAVGYMAIELAYLQKFGLLLGHPNYAVSVVLSGLLLATGIGSILSPRLLRLFGNVRFLTYALSAILLAEWALAFPRLPGFIRLDFWLRAAIVWILVGPVGLLLGAFFPTVLETLKQDAPELVPWAWGINGIFSVLAPVLSIAFSATWGIAALFIAAIPPYLVASFALPRAGESGPPKRRLANELGGAC